MRHALFVVFHYPPEASSSGVLRTLKYSRYLRENGWRVSVIAPDVSAYSVCDPQLESQIPPGTIVVRTRYVNIKRDLSIRGVYPAIFAVPDVWIGWMPWAVRAGRRLLLDDPADLIYSTSPHATSHLIAGRLARISGTPWVTDFRDPWIEDPPEPGAPNGLVFRNVNRWLEKRVVHRCSAVVTSTYHLQKLLQARYPSLPRTKVRAILNGYDEADFADFATGVTPRGARLRIVHTGNINAEFRDPAPLFKALAALISRGALLASECEIRFLGGGAYGESAEVAAAVAAAGLSDAVSFLPRVPYEASLRELSQADVFLLLQASDDTVGLVPAKLYEYLRAQKPTIALVRQGAITEVLAQTGGGWAVDPADPAELERVTAEVVAAWRADELPRHRADLAVLRRFDRRALAGELAAVFDEVVTQQPGRRQCFVDRPSAMHCVGHWRLCFISHGRLTALADNEIIPLYDGPGGASCQYFNVAGRVRWEHKNGDWKDAQGVAQGATPFATASIEATNTSRVIEWDVTALARKWMSGPGANSGLLLGTVPGQARGVVFFQSRETDRVDSRPRLLLEFADGSTQSLGPSADAHLDCTTVQSLGQDKQLHAGPDTSVVMRFALPSPTAAAELRRATLQLTTTAKQYGNAVLGVYELAPPIKLARGAAALGIAKDYPMDVGIEKNPGVYMASRFESQLWLADWSYVSPELTFWTVADDEALKFKPLDGKALRVKIPRGGTLGLDLGYNFAGKIGHEPEEVYFRYYLRFADDWMPSVDGGKLPGISGTYGRAGWGGRKYDGRLGWSMRGGFARAPDAGNPMRDYVTISTYAYHAGSDDFWGDEWVWDIGLRGLLRRNQWYCIEQYFRVNSVGASDGEIKTWVDGELALHRTGIKVRDIADIKIEKIWMNVYHGGTSPAGEDLHLYIDNVVIAKQYIGPMRMR